MYGPYDLTFSSAECEKNNLYFTFVIKFSIQLRVKRCPWIPPLILLSIQLRVKIFPWIPPLILLSIQPIVKRFPGFPHWYCCWYSPEWTDFPGSPDGYCLQVKHIYLTRLYSPRAISSHLVFVQTLFVVSIVIFRGTFWSTFLFGVHMSSGQFTVE